MTAQVAPTQRVNDKRPVLFGVGLVSLMMIALAIGFVQFTRRADPNWHNGYLVWMSLALSVLAYLTLHITEEFEFRQKIFFRISEWLAFAIFIKLLGYLTNDPARLLADLPLWQEDLMSFFTVDYMAALLLGVVVWLSSRSFANELEELYDREQDQGWDDLGKLQNALHVIRQRMVTRVFILGAVVVFLAILTRIDATALVRAGTQVPPGYNAPVANVLAYFILALALLSQTQYALLNTRWQWQRLPISEKIPVNWFRYSLVFFAILAVIVFFLPTEYSLGLFETLRVVIEVLFRAVSFLFVLLTLPISWCLSLFNISSTTKAPQTDIPPAMPPIIPAEPYTPSDWVRLLQSVLFWGIFLAVIVLALNYYLRKNTALWGAIQKFTLFRWIRQGFRAVWGWLRGVNRQVGAMVAGGVERLRQRRAQLPGQGLRLNFGSRKQTARDKVIAYYLNLVEMGRDRGLARRPAETPYQYENDLTAALPEVSQDLKGLTESFIEARYSQHTVEEPLAQEANTLWERVKRVLSNWRKPED